MYFILSHCQLTNIRIAVYTKEQHCDIVLVVRIWFLPSFMH